jgi:zinc protease
MRVLICFTLLSLACLVRPAAAELRVETFTLRNGMEVVVIPNHRVPAVSHAVWYRVGAADDPAGSSGAAHFLEHMMFRGTRGIAPGQYSKIIEEYGGRQNAFTSSDYTAYFQNIAKEHLPLVMKLEAERMQGASISAEQFMNEQKVIAAERRQQVETNPSSRLREQMEAALFLNHPYGRPVIGWMPEIQAMTAPTLRAFYQRYYNPSNAILVVAGDVSSLEVRRLAQRYYGALNGGKPVARARPAEPEGEAIRSIVMHDAQVRQPIWSRLYLAPSHHRGHKEDVYPLLVMSEILGSERTGRLYRALVVERKLAVEAGAYYDDMVVDDGTFGIQAVPRDASAIAEVASVVDAQLKALTEAPVSAEELQLAQNRLIAEATYVREGIFNLARVVGTAYAVGLDATYITGWADRIRAVTPEQIRQAAQRLFDERRSVTGQLLPEEPHAP